VAIGLAVGVTNGLIISVLRLQALPGDPGDWSILSGAALLVLPIDGGRFLQLDVVGSASIPRPLSSSVWILVAHLRVLVVVRNTRLGITIRANPVRTSIRPIWSASR